uniref:Ornithine aminotransferase n=1 Tax=Strombidium inclinatum TaxID=197538 RepID=A0A7S3IYC8_9SPIT|mmetsp:Transcript_9403/g.14363  ORF Transcript_9403/g.14363 Transcript_9403/m.14363 type:complete len:333 (+) Transcript_9403:341-1339(+)
MGAFSKYITELLGFDKFLPSSSGVEACESAIKVARRWGYVSKGVEQDKASVILPNGCFWGRSITASGACDDPARYTNFGPFTPGFHLVDYNNLEQVEAVMKKDPNLVAMMLEPIQGEAGVVIPDEGYLRGIRQLCNKYNVLLICDEVQTGLGRTGKLMGYQWELDENNQPDIVTLGKAISGGVTPVSGIVANDNIMSTIKPGDHGSTYGGNPLGMAVAQAAVECLVEEKMPENALKMGGILTDRFKAIKSPMINDVRSIGLFAAIEIHADLNVSGAEFGKILMNNGLLTKATHENAMRFAPALTITEEQIHAGADIVETSLKDLEALHNSRK